VPDTVSRFTRTIAEQLQGEYGARDPDADYVYRALEGLNRDVPLECVELRAGDPGRRPGCIPERGGGFAEFVGPL
jgi:hypothetical protein